MALYSITLLWTNIEYPRNMSHILHRLAVQPVPCWLMGELEGSSILIFLSAEDLFPPFASVPDKKGDRDNLFLHKNVFSDPSLEPSCQEGSNEGSQHRFLLRNKKNYL